ncbi:MAG: hypothetical protein AAF604_09875 [Acidobacteriota bacterium]
MGFFLTGLACGPIEAAIYRVGMGPDCDATSIQNAVNLANSVAGAHEIRLTANELFPEDVLINDAQSDDLLVISGGWLSCGGDARQHRTLVIGSRNGNFWGPFAILSNGVQQRRVILRDLFIVGENPSDDSTRIAVDISGARVDLENVEIFHGAPAMRATFGATISVDFRSLIDENVGPDNADQSGGGISCGILSRAGTGHGVHIQINGRVLRNRAVNGGGISASEGCTIALGPGALVAQNRASDNGGGIFLATGADLFAGGDAVAATRIQENLADFGGGIYLQGAGTTAQASNLEIHDNEALFGGGGVAVVDGAALRLNRSSSVACPEAPFCNTLVGNRCDALNGSALYVDSGGRAELSRGFVNENYGSGSPGPVMRANGPSSRILLEGMAFWNNRGSAVLEAANGAQVEAGFLSLARNAWLVNGGGQTLAWSFAASSSSGATIDIQASILEDTRGSEGPGNTGWCLLMDDATNMVAGVSVVGADPRFVDPDGGNLHLDSTSPAIDFCNENFLPTWTDIDLQQRGYDSAGNINGIGTFDLGFDEFIGAVGNREIFDDGFETGNTTAWSAAVE